MTHLFYTCGKYKILLGNSSLGCNVTDDALQMLDVSNHQSNHILGLCKLLRNLRRFVRRRDWNRHLKYHPTGILQDPASRFRRILCLRFRVVLVAGDACFPWEMMIGRFY